ncbi:winged helix-turn-helix domain-containing protein [Streptomyces cellulosae]
MCHRFDVEHALAGIDLLLHRIGFSALVPPCKPTERDEEKISARKDEQRPVMRGCAGHVRLVAYGSGAVPCCRARTSSDRHGLFREGEAEAWRARHAGDERAAWTGARVDEWLRGPDGRRAGVGIRIQRVATPRQT